LKILWQHLPGSGRFHLALTLKRFKKLNDAVAKATMAGLQTFEHKIIYLPVYVALAR
jgi:hypothetical protein